MKKSNMNKTQIVALSLLGLVLFDLSSIFFDENHRKLDDEPVKNQIFNIQTYSSVMSTASGTTSTTTI
jgi:hypothetical protein